MPTISLSDLRKADGSSYIITPAPVTVCSKGDFPIAATGLEHGHIYGQVGSLVKAGANLKWVYDKNQQQQAKMLEKYPDAKPARCLQEILDDPEIKLVCAADVPSNRGPLGVQCMLAGKDYFTDKTPFTTLEQLEEARKVTAQTGRKYMVYYSERIGNESSMLADFLVHQGAIGKVIQVLGLGPHRLGPFTSRPDWFFKKELYGGILCDIGSHQCEQFLEYTDSTDAVITNARVENFAHPQFPELEDFGEASLIGNNGSSFYFRVDWFTPDGLRTWGDGKTIILGTEGTIELRKNIDLGTDNGSNQLLLFDQKQEVRIAAQGTCGLKYFGDLILDCLNRTSNAMTQEHAFKAAELCIKIQMAADKNRR